MFENISKGEFSFDKAYSTDRCVYTAVVSNNAEKGSDIFVLELEPYNNMEVANNNAEFITFAFNLQQRYDISKLEEAVKQLEIATDILETQGCNMDEVKQLLKQIKK